jgi:hypothetical protein
VKKLRKVENVEESDDEFIPPLPGQEARGKSGPSAPKMEELQWQRGGYSPPEGCPPFLLKGRKICRTS